MTADPLYLFDERGRPPYAKRRVETVALSARFGDPDTSVEAAQSITPGRTERMILGVFRACNRGFTDDELATWLGPGHLPATVKSARSRLSKTDPDKGLTALLVDSGERRDSLQGRPMIVWILADG